MKKFQRNKKRNTMLIIAVAIVVGLVVSTTLIKSHANFSASKSFNIIQGKIPNKSGDIKLAVFVGGEKYKGEGFPPKENHKFKGYECTNGVTLKWNPETWRALIDTDKPTVCTLEFETKTEYEEEILKGSYPVIKDELIPVVIADNGVVTKADLNNEWYSYENSRWANAVILTGTDIYQVGDPIPEEAIESYFVWIPKYRYKLFNVEGNSISPQEIEIEFGINDTVDNNKTECKATNKSGDDGTCKDEMWMTHPAFTSLGVNGLWIGKFETGYKGSIDKASAEKNENAPEKVQIKPNVNSWRSINVSNMYNTSFNYKRNLDSHMMKNTEWGALAYLTNSKYGRGNSEIWINNDDEYVTGCTGLSVSAEAVSECTNPYGVFATTDEQRKNNVYGSTTNNISGIYDMSGGAYEYVMGFLDGYPGLSGLTVSSINAKYYDKYTVGNVGINRILGDATAETNGWNSDYAAFVVSSHPWFARGGYSLYNISSGVFNYHFHDGNTFSHLSFRLVLS